jgi:signal transduction histidine kinase
MSFDFQPTNLIAVVACVHDEFASLLSERQLQVRFQRPAEPIVAEVDQTRIMQVVRNLVNNAVKFSPQHGTIDVEVRGGAGHVRVSVRDHGIGIPEGELELIFDKFVQSSKTKSGAGGTGLGLAICRQIVEGHGGRIWAEHADGGGALFTFDLPLTQTHRHAGDLAA